ncbi:unnamed protein product, partial [Phaeothamnion confervicola]
MASIKSMKAVAVAARVGSVSEDVFAYLALTVESHLRDIVQEATKVSRASRRDRITAADVSFALQLRGCEPMFGLEGATELFPAAALSAGRRRVGLRELVEEPLPPLPQEAAFALHWLAVDGVQPAIDANPPPLPPMQPSATAEDTAGVAGAAGYSGYGGYGGPGAAAAGGRRKRMLVEVEAASPHELGEEMQRYLARLTAAVKAAGEAGRQRLVFASLGRDPGLQELLPYVCALLEDTVR